MVKMAKKRQINMKKKSTPFSNQPHGKLMDENAEENTSNDEKNARGKQSGQKFMDDVCDGENSVSSNSNNNLQMKKVKKSSKNFKSKGIIKKNAKKNKVPLEYRRIGNLRRTSLPSYNEHVLMKRHVDGIKSVLKK